VEPEFLDEGKSTQHYLGKRFFQSKEKMALNFNVNNFFCFENVGLVYSRAGAGEASK
jgi:hypothetical protein